MEWIKVTDKLPAADEYVLVCNANMKLIFIGRQSSKYSGFSFEDTTGTQHCEATHWMPLPKQPEEQLKPCPFCGFTAIYTGYFSDGHWVECTHCRCRTRGFDTKYEAAKQWNKRCGNG